MAFPWFLYIVNPSVNPPHGVLPTKEPVSYFQTLFIRIHTQN